jgi:hypothetical protein
MNRLEFSINSFNDPTREIKSRCDMLLVDRLRVGRLDWWLACLLDCDGNRCSMLSLVFLFRVHYWSAYLAEKSVTRIQLRITVPLWGYFGCRGNDVST